MNDLSLACDCGAVTGKLSDVSSRTTIRLVCYCDDCQAFAREVRGNDELLDEYGGTDVVQSTLPHVAITSGHDRLRSLKLKKGGILRWYTECCRTPVANTVSAKIPFVAVFRRFVSDDRSEEVLEPPRFRIFGRFANRAPDDLGIHPKAPLGMLAKLGPRLFFAKLRHGGKPSPFFGPDGRPTTEPRIVNQS